MQYNQFVPYTDRLDYLAPIANNVAYALAVEKLMGWNCHLVEGHPVICCELADFLICLESEPWRWISEQLPCSSTRFLKREKIYNLVEVLSGARFTTSYTRVGARR
jgi:NADH-quinone oxidoreductase subunit D